jgi:thiamine biosynthesis protein ThiS
MTTITIRINGEEVTVAAQCSINQALSYWPKAGVGENYVIALNQNFIARSQYQSTILAANDEIELLSPMAGG